MRLKNGSRSEIAASVAMVFKNRQDRVVWRSEPVRLTTFENDRTPHVGTLLPMTKTGDPNEASFHVPPSEWRSDRYGEIELTDAVAATSEDLHDAGHLATFLMNRPNAEVKAAFARDPSLIRVRDASGATPTLLAFADGDPELVDFMIARGGDPRAKTTGGRDATFFAAVSDDVRSL